MGKGIIYYTDNRLDEKIYDTVQSKIWATGLPVVSCSLKPINFGNNIVLDLQPGIVTMYKQILTALENCYFDTVFFCEHDVLYHPSHFAFELPRTDTFYYNVNVWRWLYPKNFAITYENIVSQSGLCVNRYCALSHYKKRLEKIEASGWQLKYGFEPGTKKPKRGGISDDKAELWRSEYPNIDIRHGKTLTKTKCSVKDFTHPPDMTTWKETKVTEIDGWSLQELFNL